MYGTQILIHLTPEQLGDLVEQRIAKALASYTPPLPEGSDLPELLTRKQTAQKLQVSLTTLHFWAKDTDERPAILVPVKANKQVRYRRADVLAVLKESRRFKSSK
ncbi:helix-turn-helix domain-containing protein [Spirosoma aerolatum]|uniref:helix-turn-helix domain-containing protein n=1 Tax=Spirosoma aerolatum TaxID=1211326 RepID=UPI0009ACA8AC|nr:helix-turn-helix domain-containing protein [Spirosoma aerolatum]